MGNDVATYQSPLEALDNKTLQSSVWPLLRLLMLIYPKCIYTGFL